MDDKVKTPDPRHSHWLADFRQPELTQILAESSDHQQLPTWATE
jgi:hypothetical protein